jgi:HD superfamily phosphohydrolase
MNLIGSFEDKLIGKILDPIHGIIRVTETEKKIIDHPLFQRLRNVRQNTLLYKVFPSAVHSRFEHSIGVMHLSYEVLKNLALNVERYVNKKYTEGDVYEEIKKIPEQHIINLRMAALLHDIGHGPLAHLFDKFAVKKEEFLKAANDDFNIKNKDSYLKIAKLCEGERLDHELISCIFAIEILTNIGLEKDNIDSVIKIIEKDYDFNYPDVEGVSIHKLLTSIISSCPIDADRMDYLLRDSYFSGVKYGVYDYSRLLMSLVPIKENNKVYLTFKESGIDSLLEFINARSSLFGQVYFHKTNRFLSKALDVACEGIAYDVIDLSGEGTVVEKLIPFYKRNSDNYFLENTLTAKINSAYTENPEAFRVNYTLIHDITERNIWKKVFEKKITFSNIKLSLEKMEDFISKLEGMLEKQKEMNGGYDIIVDVVPENNFKDIGKSTVKLLKKQVDDSYSLINFSESNIIFQPHHRIKILARVYLNSQGLDENLILSVKGSFKQVDVEIEKLYSEYLSGLNRRKEDNKLERLNE